MNTNIFLFLNSLKINEYKYIFNFFKKKKKTKQKLNKNKKQKNKNITKHASVPIWEKTGQIKGFSPFSFLHDFSTSYSLYILISAQGLCTRELVVT